MNDLLTALCLALAIEGAAYALAPSAMRRTVVLIAAQPDEVLRRLGLIAAILGVAGVWLARSALMAP